MKSYSEFMEYIKENVTDYLPERFEEAEISIQQVVKNNDVVLDGLSIRNPDSNISPNIYLNPLYEQYQKGRNLDELVSGIADTYIENMEPIENRTFQVQIEDIKNYEVVKGEIFPRLVNLEKNTTRLQNVPYMQREDLAITYHVKVSGNRDSIGSLMITNELMEVYGVTKEKLHTQAMENMERLSPPVFLPLGEMIVDVMTEDFGRNEGVSQEEAKEYVKDMIPTGGPNVYCLKDFFVERFERTEQQKKMIAGFREKTETYFRPVEGMNATEVEDAVRDYLMDTIRRQDLLIQIGEVMVYGSRCRGTEKTTSDIDIVVEYKGDIREDDLFNLFHEDEFLLGNHKVDINPIQADKSGNIAEFLQQATIYMESEMVFSVGNRYIYIQDATEGYDYTIYGLDMKEIDGGVYDDLDMSIYEALDEIVADLREYPDGNIVKGSVRKDSPLVLVNLDEFEEAVERSQYVPPKITYTVAECGEFHSMGRYRDNIENVNEAIALWNEYKKGTLNGVPSIGILVHTPGQTELEDVQVDLVSGKTMDLDMIRYYPEINTEEIAIQKICELVENLHDIEVIGKVPENVSAELILREFDPKQEIYNEEERSLIKEYASQVKDMPKTKGLARCICYQEKFGNQDVALAMITAREEIEDVKRGGQEYVKQI